MKWLDAVLGRTKQVRPDLDSLFAVPEAAITLEVAMGLRPTGLGSVCFRAAEGSAFSDGAGRHPAAAGRRRRAEGGGVDRLVRLHLAARAARRARAVGPGDRAARGELDAAGPRLRADAALLAGRVRGAGRPAGRAGLPLQARHVLPVRAQRPGPAGHRPGAAGPQCRRLPTCRWRRTWPAGSRCGARRGSERCRSGRGADAHHGAVGVGEPGFPQPPRHQGRGCRATPGRRRAARARPTPRAPR